MITRSFEIRSPGSLEPQVITGQIERLVRNAGLQEAQASLFLPGSGAALLSVDCPNGQFEPVQRVLAAAQQLTSDPDLLGILLGSQLAFPVLRGQLQRALWQEIFLVDFSAQARWHQVTVQMLGEAK